MCSGRRFSGCWGRTHDEAGNRGLDCHTKAASHIPPRLMPKLRTPLRARKYPQKMKGRTFYLFEVDDPLEKREKTICVHENECYEVEVSVLVRRK